MVSISSGSYHCAALDATGGLWVWGHGVDGWVATPAADAATSTGAAVGGPADGAALSPLRSTAAVASARALDEQKARRVRCSRASGDGRRCPFSIVLGDFVASSLATCQHSHGNDRHVLGHKGINEGWVVRNRSSNCTAGSSHV